MWLERLGTVDENIFFGFCAVVFVLIVIIIALVVVRTQYHNPTPGHSMTFFVIMSSLFICLSVLFRGVQPAWGTTDAMRCVCQIFVPTTVLGYTLLASAYFIKLWILLLAFRWEKNTVEWMGNFILWVLLVTAGTVIIIWVATFTPNVHIRQLERMSTHDNSSNSSSSSIQNDNYTLETPDADVLECRGWLLDGSRDAEQYGWRVAMSCYYGLLLLACVVSLPLFTCLSDVPRSARPSVVSTLLTSLNGTCCVIAGLIVWYRYNPEGGEARADSNKYAIIGSLQLWTIFVALLTTLVAEVVTWRTLRSMSVIGKHGNSQQSSTAQIGESPVISSKNHRAVVNGKSSEMSLQPVSAAAAATDASPRPDLLPAIDSRPDATPKRADEVHRDSLTKLAATPAAADNKKYEDDDNVFDDSPGGSTAVVAPPDDDDDNRKEYYVQAGTTKYTELEESDCSLDDARTLASSRDDADTVELEERSTADLVRPGSSVDAASTSYDTEKFNDVSAAAAASDDNNIAYTRL